MGIYRSTDPTTWDDLDGIVINESAPAPNVAGVAANVVILVGQAQRGPTELTEVGSIGQFHEMFGKSNAGVNQAMKNKKFGRLKVIRVVAAAAVTALKAFASTAVDRITFYAKQGAGAYGNGITVTIEAGSSVGKKYTIKDTTPGSVMPIEIYDNVVITEITSTSPFASSQLITAVVNSSAAEPANAVATALATGADGTVGDTDYQAAIAKAEVEGAGNVIFLDAYNSTRNGYLKAHVAAAQDKIAILAGAENDSVSAAVADVANSRDTDGRLIYAYPWVQTVIDGVLAFVSPASWVASVISQTSPHIDPAYVKNAGFLGGITGLKRSLTRSDYIQLKDAGIMAFENDQDIGFKIKSGVVTQIADSSKVLVLRRRMTDFLTNSIARFLKQYQNSVASKANRTLIKSAIATFDKQLENDGILPKDSEVQSGKAKLIDTESLNTDSSIAAGFLKLLYKRRIYSTNRFIVLQTEIGESVTVTEGEA